MIIYLAAPVFSQCERIYNRRLAELLEKQLPGTRVVLPQDFRIPGRASFNDRRHLAALFKQCRCALQESDLVLAILDGADADSGVAFEVGYARGLGKPVVGLRTDYRQLQLKGLNMMLAEGCTEIVCRFSFNERLEDTVAALVEKIEHSLARHNRLPQGRQASGSPLPPAERSIDLRSHRR